ncbi:MAG: CHAD domain-containing protein [Segniliparus sp.]|uniref:CYTH and CHAD domain-containing protein n=1 Tax=Segniliparus sp. TaxID=2804064 RepID=UPI003F2E6B4F
MPVAEHLERESKYDADLSADTPQWEGLGAGDPVGSILRAVYFDTPDLRLLAEKITLRWRSGEAEEGWHLKLPASAGRIELQARAEGCDPDRPPDPARMPDELADRLRAWTRSRELVPIARLVTLREETEVPGAGTFCDDLVTATDLIGAGHEGGATTVWREWEFELVDDPDPARVRRVDELVLRYGALPSASSSKVARALGRSAPPAKAAGPGRKPPSVGAFLAVRLKPMRDRLCAQDFPVRTDEHDSVHQLRVTTRTLRSLLQAFGPVLRKGQTKHVSDELRWLASELGTARDAEVRAERFESLAAAKKHAPPRGAAAHAATALAAEEREAYRLAHNEVLAALDSRRYFRLLDALDAYVAEPPVRKGSRKAPAEAALSEAVAGAAARLFAADEALAEATDHAEREEGLHEVRKRAKGLRYVGDLASEASSTPSGPSFAWAAPVKQLQELLGGHQDAVVLRDWLRARAEQGGNAEFQHGVDQLIASERARARKSEAAYPAAISAVRAAWAGIGSAE